MHTSAQLQLDVVVQEAHRLPVEHLEKRRRTRAEVLQLLDLAHADGAARGAVKAVLKHEGLGLTMQLLSVSNPIHSPKKLPDGIRETSAEFVN